MVRWSNEKLASVGWTEERVRLICSKSLIMRNLSATERPSFTNLEELLRSKGLVADNIQLISSKCIHNVISPNNSTDSKDGSGNKKKKVH